MPTQHPTLAVINKLQTLAREGSEDARNLLTLYEECIHVLEATNGFEHVFGLLGDSPDEICAQQLDDALSDLFPTILRVSAGGWESLKFYAPSDMPFPEGKGNAS
jgi:hypothetical protein